MTYLYNNGIVFSHNFSELYEMFTGDELSSLDDPLILQDADLTFIRTLSAMDSVDFHV